MEPFKGLDLFWLSASSFLNLVIGLVLSQWSVIQLD